MIVFASAMNDPNPRNPDATVVASVGPPMSPGPYCSACSVASHTGVHSTTFTTARTTAADPTFAKGVFSASYVLDKSPAMA